MDNLFHNNNNNNNNNEMVSERRKKKNWCCEQENQGILFSIEETPFRLQFVQPFGKKKKGKSISVRVFDVDKRI
jgi:hypothetical protein